MISMLLYIYICIYIYQLERYYRACVQEVLDTVLLLSRKLQYQCFLLVKLKFYGRYLDLFNRCGISLSQTTTSMFRFSVSRSIVHDLSPN